MNSDNDWFFDKFDHDTDKFFKGFGCLWLIGATLSFLVSIAFIVACVVVILHVV